MNSVINLNADCFENTNDRSRSFPAPCFVEHEEIKRPDGYILPGYRAFSVTLRYSSGITAKGFGEGSESLAIKKATSEAIERMALYLFRAETNTKESSNGWAAHLTKNLAIQNSILELIERDVAVRTWENGGEFLLVPESLWPTPVVSWKKKQSIRPEFFDLKILLSSTVNGACISALLFNETGNFVAGHASGLDLGDAILSALNECLRAAHLAVRFEYLSEVFALHSKSDLGVIVRPGAHSLAYAYGEKMPEEVAICEDSVEKILNRWQRHRSNFFALDLGKMDISLFEIGQHVVARVKSPRYQQIYWGTNRDLSKPNTKPHFVG